MPQCKDCKLYDLERVKNARGAIMSKRVAKCRWVSKEQWPVAVGEHMNRRPQATYMPPTQVHRCPCFQKVESA